MATTADVLRSVDLILKSGERRHQREVDRSLSMMQFSATKELREREMTLKESQLAEQKRLSDITLAKQNLELASKSLEMQKPKIAARFLQSTGLSAIYQESEEGEAAEEAITDMAERLRSKQYFGKKFDVGASQDIAGAVWSYYSGEDPNAVLSIADSLHESGLAIDSGKASSSQKKLFEAFNNLGLETNLKDITLGASRALDSEMYIDKEISEFLKGDYEIQSDIGVYAGVPAKVEDSMAKFKIQAKPKAARIMSIDETRSALKIAEQKLGSLRSKIDNKLATDEEKEESYKLPGIIDEYRNELKEASDFLTGELDSEIGKLEKALKTMKKRGMHLFPEYQEAKAKLVDLRDQKRDLSSERSEQLQMERREEDIEEISEATGIPESEVKYQIEEKNRRALQVLTSQFGSTNIYPGMRVQPEKIDVVLPKKTGSLHDPPWLDIAGRTEEAFLGLLESIGLYNASDS